MKFINLAFYCFFDIPEPLEPKRLEIKTLCLEGDLKGTVVLAREGINLMVSGSPESIRKFQDFLRRFIGRDQLSFKESTSDYQPFNRMLVKAKQMILPANDTRLSPAAFQDTHLKPEALKTWLDQKRDFILLDTRNQFEFHIGSFKQARQIGIEHFRYFEEKLNDLPDEWKEKQIVTFCTGGIRCEKAVPLMKKHGFKNVFQLDGGILNYFEKVGGDYYQGDCFVFDRRVAVDSRLHESDIVECFQCRHPVTPEEQKMESYIYEKSCPYCFEKEKV